MRHRDGEPPNSSPRLALLAVVAALVFVACVRLRLADVPLERDEGEYAYAGQLILQGIPPYELAYNMKFPGTYYAYAAILAIFGHTPWGIRVGLLLVNAATILLVFALGRRLLGGFSGAVAAVIFAVLSIDRFVFGAFAHATHFVVLCALAGLLVLLRGLDGQRTSSLFWSGAILGVSVLMKQHAIVFLPFAAALAFWGGRPEAGSTFRVDAKRVGVVAAGSVLPPAVMVAALAAQGVFGRFWFWTIRYASVYASENSLSSALPNLTEGFKAVTVASLAFWVLGAFGFAAIWIARWEPEARAVLTGLAAASFLAMCPGFYFREHYFILALPAVALLGGVAVGSFRQILDRRLSRAAAAALAVALFAASIGLYAARERAYLFTMGTRELSRTTYGTNPFIEAVEIAKYIRDHSDENDRIAVLGSEPEIYFYAARKAATGYIYTYALMEPQPYAKTMQDEMIREIESARPLYLVFSLIDVSWLPQQGSNQGIMQWGNRYARKCYDPVGVADVFSEAETGIVWGEEAVRGYEARSSNLVYTFRRKSDAPCALGP